MEENTVNEEVQDQVQEETPSYSTNDDGDYVLNSNEETTETDAVQEQETTEVSLGEQTGDSQEVADEVREPEEKVDSGEVQEQDKEDVVELGQVSESEAPAEEPVKEEEPEPVVAKEPELPEAFGKMVLFLKENPGATPEDYISVTKGADAYTDEQILKMHLASESGLDVKEDSEEVDFLYNEKFGYDEDLDEDRDIKLKKIELKKTLKEAKTKLNEVSEKYAGSLTFKDQSPGTQEAVKFYEQHKTESEKATKLRSEFKSKTDKLFSEIKGFDFKYGDDQKQTIRIGNADKVSKEQIDINNFVNKFSDGEGNLTDVAGYHKALWAANNVDALFSHAYEQGKADAVRDAAKKAKNISMDPRQDAGSITDPSTSRFKLVDADSDDGFKFNI